MTIVPGDTILLGGMCLVVNLGAVTRVNVFNDLFV